MAVIETLLEIDAALRTWLTDLPHPLWLDYLMRAASVIGRGGSVWFVLAFLIGWRRRASVGAAFRAGLTVLLVQLCIDLVIKPSFGRPRPFADDAEVRVIDIRSESPSFPSGHAANSFAGALSLTRAWPEGRAILWPLALLVSLSRIYVGVHYPLDVLAGALFGLGVAYVVTGAARAPTED